MPDKEAVVVSHVTKTLPKAYGWRAWLRHRGNAPRQTVLRDISFSAKRGELLGFLGANGAGKSTILRILAGLMVPDTGTVRIGDFGFCTSDERSFYFRLTARQNLRYFGTLAGLRPRDLDRRIEEVARACDLHRDLDRRFDTFSAGMRQRLAVTRAMLVDPEVLLLDEPTTAVDPVHAHGIRTFVRDELVNRRGKTVILATNLLEEAWEMCDRIIVLRAGEIVATGSPSELGRMAMERRHFAIVVDRADDALLRRTRAVPGLVDVLTVPDEEGVCLRVELDSDSRTLTKLLHAVSSNGVSIAAVREEAHPAQIFAALTGFSNDIQ